MASAGPQNAGTGSYVEAPENVQVRIDERMNEWLWLRSLWVAFWGLEDNVEIVRKECCEQA
jgi:hypothetical protein